MALLGRAECHPQLQGDFPASDGSAHAAWQGHTGTEPWRKPLEIHEIHDSSAGSTPGCVAAQDGASVHLWHLLLSHEGWGSGFVLKSQGEVKAGRIVCLRVGCVLLQPCFYHQPVKSSNIFSAVTDTSFKENCLLNCPFYRIQ